LFIEEQNMKLVGVVSQYVI